MPTVKFDRVVSCNSEDVNHPASNLLESESYKKWKCKTPGEKQAIVVLQLESSSRITGIDIGNEYSAFVEVLVGRACSNDEYKVLLVSSSFMSPLEGRNGTNTNRVRMFARDQLSKPAVDEAWDRVKVVCSQPFNKHVQYGLCFVTLHSPEIKTETPSNVHYLGRFRLKEDDDSDNFAVGSLFSRRKEKPPDEPFKGAAAIRQASSPAALSSAASTKLYSPASKPAAKLHVSATTPKSLSKLTKEEKSEKVQKAIEKNNSTNHSKTPNASKEKVAIKAESASAPNSPTTNKTKKAQSKESDTQQVTGKGKLFASQKGQDEVRNGTASIKRQHTTGDNDRNVWPKKLKTEETKTVIKKPFNKLLESVVFVISGYQNPDRSNMRDMALEMGAKYKPDWDNTCTHLICAFMNTPKFQQVQGRGHIVKKDWVEQCYSRRARLPWRRYALDKKDQSKPESEDEILEEVPALSPSITAPNGSRNNAEAGVGTSCGAASGSDTEDEIERVRLLTAAYNADTEVDEDSDSDGSSPLPSTSDVFLGHSFYLHPALSPEQIRKLDKSIIANKGTVLSQDASDVDYVVARRTADTKKELKKWPKATFVDVQWVSTSIHTKMLQPSSSNQSWRVQEES